MPDETALLKEISQKMSQLIVLSKLTNLKLINDIKQEIQKDGVCKKILDLADGSLSSSQLKDKTKTEAKVSESTVKRRLSFLVERGALVVIKKGSEVFYENSGLYD